MGDPVDFAMGRRQTTIPKEVWDSLDRTLDLAEGLLCKAAANMSREAISNSKDSLRKSRRVLDKYKGRHGILQSTT